MRFAIREEGYDFVMIEADDAEGALDGAEAAYADSGSYDTSNGTVWVTWHAIDEDGRAVASRTIRIDPPEPRCLALQDHDWQSPYELLGGLKENPGVWGHGGGVVIHEVCAHCGCLRVTDTWVQDPSTGEQGLRSVKYEPRKYASEVRELVEVAS